MEVRDEEEEEWHGVEKLGLLGLQDKKYVN